MEHAENTETVENFHTAIPGDPRGTEQLILAGLQSVDRDTAQVPPQVAEELGIAHVGGVTGYFIDPERVLHLRRAIPGGTETVALERYPCLVTLHERVPPPYPTFVRTR